MFEKYEVPEMEVVRFDEEDVIVTSGGNGITSDSDEIEIR